MIGQMTRFSEGFFVIKNSRKQALMHKDSNYQDYAAISDSIRNSQYFAALPNDIFDDEVGNSKDNSDIQAWPGFWYAAMIFQTFQHNFNPTTEPRQIFHNLIWHLKGSK